MTDLEMRFWDKVRIGDGCWEWQAAHSQVVHGLAWRGDAEMAGDKPRARALVALKLELARAHDAQYGRRP